MLNLKPEYMSLSSLLSKRLFGIPDYQRAYSWERKQRLELFGDIEKIMISSDNQRHHFMATIVCLVTDQTEEVGTDELVRLDIVDGQQRLTTLIILLKAIAKYFEDSEVEIERKQAQELNDLLVKDNGRLILLQTNHRSKIIFSEYLKKGKLPDKDKLLTLAEYNLYDAFVECEEFVNGFQTGTAVLSLLKVVKNRLDFIFYDLQDEGAVYTVFEVLNSRGLAVAWLDKCKSAMMGIVFENEKTVIAKERMIILNEIWSQIYLTIGKKVVRDDEILTIAASLRNEENLGKPLSVEKSVECFKEEALKDSERTVEISKWILKVAQELVELYTNPRLNAVTDISHARILAIAIKVASQFSKEERKQLLTEWERITFLIFGLHRKDSRFRVGAYLRIARKLTKNEIKDINEAIKGIKDIAERFTIDDAIDEIKGEDWYGSFDNDAKYLLYRYEEYLAQQKGEKISEDIWKKIWSDTPAKTIEHIHPKTYIETWRGKIGESQEEIDPVVNGIGNLILLPPGINSKAGQKKFQEKKEIYSSYHLLMIDEVSKLSEWNKESIAERESRLLDFIRNMWG